MKKTTRRLAMSSLLLSLWGGSLVAHAVQKVGNGSGGFICPDPRQSTLLDLHEAEHPDDPNVPALHIPLSDEPVETQIQNAFLRLPSPQLYQDTLATYRTVRQARIEQVPAGKRLPWPEDAGTQFLPDACSAIGLMLYHDEDITTPDDDWLDQDTDKLRSLPNTPQAMSWAHETVFLFIRKTQAAAGYKEPNSIRTRKIVAHLFADEPQADRNRALAELYGMNAHTSHGIHKSGERELSVNSSYLNQEFRFLFASTRAPDSDPRCGTPEIGRYNVIETSLNKDRWDAHTNMLWLEGYPGPFLTFHSTADNPNNRFAVCGDYFKPRDYHCAIRLYVMDFSSGLSTSFNLNTWTPVNERERRACSEFVSVRFR